MTGLFVMPLLALVLFIYVTHSFAVRYALRSMTGTAILSAALLAVGRMAVLCRLVALSVFRAARVLHHEPRLRAGQPILDELRPTERAANDAGPIVIADHHVFLEFERASPSRATAQIATTRQVE
jgi:hypothetical protein